MEIQLTATTKAVEQFIDAFIQQYKEALLRDGKKATGNLLSSIKKQALEFANGKLEASISIADYWKWVEYGRKPGKFPPVDKILGWIRAKPVIPRPMNGLKPPTEPQLAFLIARKIARDGIKPGNQFIEALESTWRKWEQHISDAISKDLNQAISLVTLL